MNRFALTIAALAAFVATPILAQDKNPVVVMETSKGTIKIELNAKQAPISVQNFLKYVDGKHFDDTVFHRVIADFMIQGGGFSSKLVEKETKDAIKNESKNGLKNDRGTIAMARTNDPDSATAQFYINVKDNPALNGSDLRQGYAVFGKVIAGMDVVDKIRQVKTGTRRVTIRLPNGTTMAVPFEDVPVENVVIKSVRRVKK